MECSEFEKKLAEVIKVDPERKPKLAILELTGLPKENIFASQKKGLCPYARVFLLSTDPLKEFCGVDEAEFYIDLMYFSNIWVDDHIECLHKGEVINISLSEDDRRLVQKILQQQCVEYYQKDIEGILEAATQAAYKLYGKPDEIKVQCNQCTFSFTPMPIMEAEGEYEAVFFECPTCHKKYLVAVSDSQLRDEIRGWQVAMKEYGQFDQGDVQNAERYEELKEWQKRNIKRSRELCEKYRKLKEEKESNGETKKETECSAGNE